MKKIAFLFGGRSEEHEVSLASAASLLPRLLERGHQVSPIFIDKDGSLYRLLSADGLKDRADLGAHLSPASLIYDGASLYFLSRGERFYPELFFSALHGGDGEDGAWQGLFQLSGVPFIGCDLLSSAVCMNKAVAKELVRAAGVPTAHYLTVRDARDGTLSSVEKLFSYPVFVKPTSSGSSFGASRADERNALFQAVSAALAFGGEVLVEEYIDGEELSVAVLEKDGILSVSPAGKILSNGVFDYEQKYNSGFDTLLCPAPLPEDEGARIRELAKTVFRALRCRHIARIDFFRTRDGRILFNETNTLPGFTDHSLYPRLLSYAGEDALSLLDGVTL